MQPLACCACATGDGCAAAMPPTGTRRTSCGGAGLRQPPAPTPEPMTVRGRRALPSQPLRGDSRCPDSADAAVREERSQPACGERRPASGVPGPDSADRPDGAERAARASAGDLAGRAAIGETAERAAPMKPARWPARGSNRAGAREGDRPTAAASHAPGRATGRFASGHGRRRGASEPVLARGPCRASHGAGPEVSGEAQLRGPPGCQVKWGATGESRSRSEAGPERAPDSRSFGSRRAGDCFL